jgi:hypothetical protein
MMTSTNFRRISHDAAVNLHGEPRAKTANPQLAGGRALFCDRRYSIRFRLAKYMSDVLGSIAAAVCSE